jgi:hypothetical protein
MVITWLFNNLPYCKTDDYYWISDNLLDTQFFDIVNRCGPWKIHTQKQKKKNKKNLPKFFYLLKKKGNPKPNNHNVVGQRSHLYIYIYHTHASIPSAYQVRHWKFLRQKKNYANSNISPCKNINLQKIL